MPTVPISPSSEKHYLGVGRQAARGTGVVPTHFATFVDRIGLTVGQQLRKIREAGSALYPARHVKDVYLPGAEFGHPIRPDEAAFMMALMLGTSPAPTGTDPYTHTITPNEVQTWASIERNIGDDLIERLIDAFFIEAVIDIRKRDSGPEPVISYTVGALSVQEQGAAQAESYETDKPFLRSDATWTVDGVGLVNTVETCTITLRWAFDEGVLADALIRGDAVKLRLDGTIELVNLYRDPADIAAYRLIEYGPNAAAPPNNPEEQVYTGDFDVEFDHSRGGVTEDQQRQFKVTIPVVDWTMARVDEPQMDANEAIRIRRTGEMMANPGASPITITAINAVSGAYIP